jgi:hypothetical protein
MKTPSLAVSAALVMLGAMTGVPAFAAPFFSTGTPDGKIATASRPGSAGISEIESADDFILGSATTLTGASFTGLVPVGSSIKDVIVEIYRVFPLDSDIGRTSGAPIFSTPQVPTRMKSPSDVALASRDSGGASLSFTTSVLAASFTTANSVQAGGINPEPNQTTGGDGPVTGAEVEFDVIFTNPLSLSADQYFFVPQVELDTGYFYWLSVPKPIVAPGTPFAGDLQSWIRDEALDPDWLRIGTDIVSGPGFNAAFTLTGSPTTLIPAPGAITMMMIGISGLVLLRRRSRS